YRDRVVRDKRFKLFVNTNGGLEKLIDLTNDPEEETNLLGSAGLSTTQERLAEAVHRFPKVDADPIYERIEYPAYIKIKKTSGTHKTRRLPLSDTQLSVP
ncbi:MAG: hypothetical protein KDB27_32130, partial [Planctomycetales bacterium]|nr:hypothetical protein [Planctomycetales bacterium]